MNTITLINWQAHKRSVVSLAPTITSIIGRSDHGKSSIIRGIEWVRTNSPSGIGFIRKGTNTCKVFIDAVQHHRTKSQNFYKIEGHEEPFMALRQSVPEQVTAKLNLSEDNVQEQQGKLFLLHDSPGVRAAKLSSIIDVAGASKALDHVRGEKARIKGLYATAKASVEKAETQVKELTVFEEVNLELTLLEQKQTKIDELKTKRGIIAAKVQKADQASILLKELPDISALGEARELKRQCDEITALRRNRTTILGALTKAENNAWFSEVGTFLNSFKKEAGEVLKLMEERSAIDGLVFEAEKWNEEGISIGIELSELKAHKDALMGDTCPLCGSEIK